MFKQVRGKAVAIGGAILLAVVALAPAGHAQYPQYRQNSQEWQDWDWDGNYQRLVQINAGTYVTIRTTQIIQSQRSDGRLFPAAVDEDVWDEYGRLVGPAIPRGSRADLIVRTAGDGDLILDLDAIYAHGNRYSVDTMPERFEGLRRGKEGEDLGAYLGGGALLGTVIGAIAGGGKGAGIGAAAGAAAGLAMAYRGQAIRIPAGSRITFQLQRPLMMRMDTERQPPRPYRDPAPRHRR